MPAIFIYRLGRFFIKIYLKPIGRLLTYLNRLLFSVWLPSSIQIGKNFKLGYWGLGVVIHHNAVIGDDVTIGQNVTIGRNLGDMGVPKLGNNVYVGAGTIIFGNILIGNNVIIGANSVVNKNIESNSIVVGNPMKVIASNTTYTYQEIDSGNNTEYWKYWFK
ncbi:MAG: serine O-acetyltransferase [Francisellaceae bacterium]|jgi:serine O-acetyltransferase